VLNIPAQATDGGYLKTIAGKNSEIARFNAGLERLTAERNQISDENRKFKESFEKTKSGLIAAIIIGALGIIIAIAVGYNKWKAMDSLLWSAYLEGQSLLQVNITDLKIGNTDNAGNWLTSPGEALESAKMRYLMPVITLNSVISGNITLNCKIIDGRGIVIRNPSISPEGYSNTTTINVSRSGNQSFKLTGWGNNDQSTYGSGEWTVEVWWNDVCLKSAKIRIN
jgi:hypothetical protein